MATRFLEPTPSHFSKRDSANLLRIAEHEPGKRSLKSKGLFFQEKEKRLSAIATAHLPNLMFPVSRRELAPASRDI
jgi:hypothetical protein